MSVPERRSLPPMVAIEFAIDRAFRHFIFALGLLLGWVILLLPLIGFAWYTTLRNGPPDVTALSPLAMAALGLLACGLLLASFSIEVNWNRRILLDERPVGLLRWRLDGVVWRYMAAVLLLLVVLAIHAAAGFAVMTAAVPALSAQLGTVARPLGIVVTVLIGLSALFSLYRRMGWLAAVALGDREFSVRTAYRVSRGNRIAFLAFTFWLLFSLAVMGALGAGAFFAQQSLPQPWVKPVAWGAIAVLAWLALLIIHSVPAALYRVFR